MRLAALFSDHAVLQRDLEIPVWGWDVPGTRIVVRLAGNEAHTVAASDGSFLVRLPALAAGGPHELVAEGTRRASARDLLVGEVWICSGQSNMAVTAADADWEPEFPRNAEQPRLRCFTVRNQAVDGERADAVGSWLTCSAATVAGFTAVGFAFARELHSELGVAIGLVCNAYGGTRIEAWTSRSALVQSRDGRLDVAAYESALWTRATAELRGQPPLDAAAWERRIAPADPGIQGEALRWADPAFDDGAWRQMPVPSHWQDHGHGFSGIFWFRRAIAVPASWAGRDLQLELGACDKHDITFVNGERVGAIGWEALEAWRTPRVYRVPGRLVQAGRLVIAARVSSHKYDGGMTGPAPAMRIAPVDAREASVALDGDWRYAIERDFGSVPPAAPWVGPGNSNAPYILFDCRIAPLLPYGIRGVIWYQGESNVGEARLYREQMRTLIDDWRRAWGQGSFSFLIAQLANHKPARPEPAPSDLAMLREAQLRALDVPDTGLAVTIDIGDADDIHPRNKREVGRRLARWALVEPYGRAGLPSGPLAARCLIAGDRIRVLFRHVGDGLVARGGELRQFAVAGADRRFRWAEATIDGAAVAVRSAQVPQPVAVRYAWADNPEGCNLYNSAGLPASPFRSDDWPA